MTKEFVNLIKLCVGAQNVSDLYEWQKNRLIHDKSLENHATFFITRMRPKRENFILNGGSIFWVFRGLILALLILSIVLNSMLLYCVVSFLIIIHVVRN